MELGQLGVARRSIGGGSEIFVSASRSSGSKLPRHQGLWCSCGCGHGRHFFADEKKDLEFQGLSLRWCPEGDSNSHSFRKRILNPPRLPIPPSGLNGGEV